MTSPRRVAGYCRVSTTRQADEGISLEMQRKAIAAYCAAYQWPEPIIYEDAGVSAHKHDIAFRPAFARLLDDAEARAVDTIIVVSMDRWGRSLAVIVETLERLERAGVALISLREHVDYSTAVGKLTTNVLGSIAQFTSDERSETSTRVHAELKAQGKHDGGPPPYGAAIGPDGRLTLDPRKSPILARILELAATNTHYAVAEILNKEGIPPPGASRKYTVLRAEFWWPRSAGAVIRNSDWLLTQPDPWPGRYLAAISRPKAPPVRHDRTGHALTGLIRCAHCEGSAGYVRANRNDVWRLRCIRHTCYHTHRTAGLHEAAILAAVTRLTLREGTADAPPVDAAAWRAIQAERERAGELYQLLVYDRPKFLAVLAEINARAANLAASTTPSKDMADVARLLPALPIASPQRQNAVYRQLIDRVYLDRDQRRIVWHPWTLQLFDGCAA